MATESKSEDGNDNNVILIRVTAVSNTTMTKATSLSVTSEKMFNKLSELI